MCKTETKSEDPKTATTKDDVFTWAQVSEHNKKDDKWLVIDNEVYDITRWSLRHPGGSKVISHYAGQDATEPFRAFHNDPTFVRKFMNAIRIGMIREDQHIDDPIKKDFEELRQTAYKMNLFKPSVLFFSFHLWHIIGLELLSYYILYAYGADWLPWLSALACQVILQAQVGWTQHDYGHLSVFGSTALNTFFQQFTQCFIKGAGADWWKHLHYQHHAKPNVMGKDPDMRLEALLVIGDPMAQKVAKRRSKSFFFNLPYSMQDKYFYFTLPPLLFPTYFQVMIFKHTITRKKWMDLAWLIGYYAKFSILMTFLLGGVWPMLKFYWTLRILEGMWFVWVTQSNHVPMEVDYDKEKPWLPLQLGATCNIEHSLFNDWFTGHLNFQIEHHLFPTMPRHNYHQVQPLVQSLCKKHGIDYKIKTMTTAFADIIRTLKHSGQLWEHYYEAYHMEQHIK